MPAKLEMSWDAKSRRWWKMYKGKRYVISCRQLNCEPTKEGSYRLANSWWSAKRQEIDGQGRNNLVPDETLLGPLNHRIDWMDTFDSQNPNAVRDVFNLPEDAWEARLAAAGTLTKTDRPLAAHVPDYLAREQARVKAGTLTLAEWDMTRLCVNYFVQFVGSDLIDAKKWEAYWIHLVGLECGAEYKKKRFRHARSFVTWLDEHRMIEAPRNLESRRFKFTVTLKAIPTLTNEEVTTLIGGAPGQLKLHLLLMLNCGYTQVDISDLRRDEIDLNSGTITRKRSKTAGVKNVPTVTYKLWPATLDLLKQYIETEGDLALRTRSKTSWVVRVMKGEKFSRVDNIKSNYVHLVRKTKIRKPIKLLRKTSASMLETHDSYSRMVGLFLGHAPTTIADRHYAAPSQARFDEALEWLGEQFGKTITG